jgi:hypothetical protein
MRVFVEVHDGKKIRMNPLLIPRPDVEALVRFIPMTMVVSGVQ